MKLPIFIYVALHLIIGSAAYAQSKEKLPAVDGVNGKLSFSGVVDGPDVLNASGALTFPIGHNLGLQFDGYVANIDDNFLGNVPVYGGGAHLFWRDPSKGLIGFYTDAVHFDVLSGYTVFTTGVEGSLYLGRFSIDGLYGYSYGDIREEDIFSNTRVSYYPTDNLNLFLGHGYSHSQNNFIYGGEWAFGKKQRTASSFFAKGSVNEHGNHVAEVGLTIYFGKKQKPLIRRHREDDPAINIDIQPLTNEASLASGVTLYFLELPEFDFDATALFNILDIHPMQVARYIAFGY